MKSPSQQSFDDSPDRKHVLALSLRRRILTMQMQPGAVLDEYALAEEFGLSRPPVRELLRQMAGEGYIELEANRPARVTSMSHQSLRNFYLVAPMIYVATTRLAAERRSTAAIDELKAIQEQFTAAIREGDTDGRVFFNDSFHLKIGQMAENDYLLPSLRRCLIDHARIAKIFYDHQTASTPRMTADRDEAARQHEGIIQAIETRDADAAEALVRAHLDLSRRNMAMYAAPESMNVRFDN